MGTVMPALVPPFLDSLTKSSEQNQALLESNDLVVVPAIRTWNAPLLGIKVVHGAFVNLDWPLLMI